MTRLGFNILNFIWVAFEQAWNAPYESDHHEFLFDTVKEIRSDPLAEYSNSASVIQSSGSGKSRMVDEMASLIFTLPFNLRAARDVYGEQLISAHSPRQLAHILDAFTLQDWRGLPQMMLFEITCLSENPTLMSNTCATLPSLSISSGQFASG